MVNWLKKIRNQLTGPDKQMLPSQANVFLVVSAAFQNKWNTEKIDIERRIPSHTVMLGYSHTNMFWRKTRRGKVSGNSYAPSPTQSALLKVAVSVNIYANKDREMEREQQAYIPKHGMSNFQYIFCMRYYIWRFHSCCTTFSQTWIPSIASLRGFSMEMPSRNNHLQIYVLIFIIIIWECCKTFSCCQ